MSKRASKRGKRIRDARRKDYDENYKLEEGFIRPGSTNVHKSRTLQGKR